MKNIAGRDDYDHWLCPDLRTYWHLGKVPETDQIVLQALTLDRHFVFAAIEGFALRYFIGSFTIAQVQAFCQQAYGAQVSATLVVALLQKLVTLGILESSTPETLLTPTTGGLHLKEGVTWIYHPEGYWLLRNAQDVTFLQLNDVSKQVIEQLGQIPFDAIVQRYNLDPSALNHLLKLLAATGMLEGTTLPTPPKRKFNPLHLLFFRFPLFNPDTWLAQHVGKLLWLWTRAFAALLSCFLAATIVIGFADRLAWFEAGQQLWHYHGTALLIPFILLCVLVVSLHELGHAFTLKYYGGIVPEIGLLFMCLMPGCYTNTTDSYCLVKRRQRALVVGAGILCQLTLWAISFWFWKLAVPGTWLSTTSYLLMAAALLTVAINLNPLAKFDGYYLAVALSGINNLRSRSFGFYAKLLSGHPTQESRQSVWMLVVYAPLSLTYSVFVFGHSLLWLSEWCLLHLPTFTSLLLTSWLVYFYCPKTISKTVKSV